MTPYSIEWYNALAGALVQQAVRAYRKPLYWHEADQRDRFCQPKYRKKRRAQGTWSFVCTLPGPTYQVYAVAADTKQAAIDRIMAQDPQVIACRWPKNHGDMSVVQATTTRKIPMRMAPTIQIDQQTYSPEEIAARTGLTRGAVLHNYRMYHRIHGPNHQATWAMYERVGAGHNNPNRKALQNA
jgi:hypothetical protein